jgi:hypothetical protein
MDLVTEASDTLLSTTRSVGSLTSGQAATGAVTLTIPASIAPGRYVVLACADDLDQVQETDNGNNCRASAEFEVSPPQ